MPKILIQPLGVTVEAERGATLMEAAHAEGYYWPSTCGGEGRCTTCTTAVQSGTENLSSMGRSERKTLISELGPRSVESNLRLACQARVEGDGVVEVRKVGVRPMDALFSLRSYEPDE